MADVAIVTGGAGGLGSSVCAALAEDGLRVVVADYNGEGAQALAAKLKSEGREALGVGRGRGRQEERRGDDPERRGRLRTARPPDQFRRPHGALFHRRHDRRGVGPGDPCEPAGGLPVQPGRRDGHALAQAGADHQRRLGQGASLAHPTPPHYSASKAGVIAFTKSMAVEVTSDNILVNNICPGRTGDAHGPGRLHRRAVGGHQGGRAAAGRASPRRTRSRVWCAISCPMRRASSPARRSCCGRRNGELQDASFDFASLRSGRTGEEAPHEPGKRPRRTVRPERSGALAKRSRRTPFIQEVTCHRSWW